jgi:hypothetical protein
VVLLICGALAAGPRGTAGPPAEDPRQPAKPATPAASKQARPADAADTHQRIKGILTRLGIQAREEEPAGCTCGRPKKQREERGGRTQVSMPPFLGYVLVGIVFAAMLVPLILALRSGYRDVNAATDDEDAADAANPDAPTRGPWRVDLADCQRLFAAGQLVLAFAALHRAVLVALERQGCFALDASTTNWAYVRRLAAQPELRRVLAAVTEAAERAVLGGHTPDAARYRELEQLVAGALRK